MHRIDGANATIDNKFTLGNPGAGIPATTVTADILNAFQEELCKVIETAGLILNKADNTQLFQAMQRLTFSTGDGKITLKNVADPGWVLANDGTIGNAGSGATNRANADTQALYTLLWNNIADADAPVTGGRGVSAAADFTALKPIALTKQLGRAIAIAGSGAGLTPRALGHADGNETHTLTQAETPLKNHGHVATDPGHGHIEDYDTQMLAGGSAPNILVLPGSGTAGTTHATRNSTTGITITNTGDASAAAHDIMNPRSYWNVMIKL